MLKRASEINYNHLRVMITLISSHLDLGQRSILLQYVDAIRLNATSTEAVGLAYGLAGISIALMETATLLGDKKLENEAISLLKSCLINHHVDLSFENGWGGILYATRYLIRTDLLEIDYGEVLGKQEALVAKHIHELSADTHNFKSHVEACSYALLYADQHNASCFQLLTNNFNQLFAHYAERWRKWYAEDKDFIDESELAQWHQLVHLAQQFNYRADATHLAFYQRCVKNHRIKESSLHHLRINCLRGKSIDLKRFIHYTERHALLSSLEDLISLYILSSSSRRELEALLFPLIFDHPEKRVEQLIPLLRQCPLCCLKNGLSRLLLFIVWLYLPEGQHRNVLSHCLI
ncbi:hypothetical protein HMPREF9999_00020 [Alloprevotella sp. oral taxon 473 str. F0040]|nr:hypothetical protein HMPREF9999_00020 [Alloprevotella sp. oral taxon 473 str. F0040]